MISTPSSPVYPVRAIRAGAPRTSVSITRNGRTADGSNAETSEAMRVPSGPWRAIMAMSAVRSARGGAGEAFGAPMLQPCEHLWRVRGVGDNHEALLAKPVDDGVVDDSAVLVAEQAVAGAG